MLNATFLFLLLALHCHRSSAGRSSPFLGLRALKQQKKEAMLAGKNVILFLTDQERPTMHFPDGWEEENLPGLTRLKRNGLTFNLSRTNACMCSAARATLLSGLLPAQHGVRYVLEENMPPEIYPQVSLPTGLTGLAQVAAAAGLEPVYKGKLHVTAAGGPNGTFLTSDAGQYGWTRWNPQDKGGNQDLCEGGGDKPNATDDHDAAWPEGQCGNADERYMQDDGDWEMGLEGALAYLKNEGARPDRTQPFFLVVSLINPHDVLMFQGWNNSMFNQTNYGSSFLEGPIGLPVSVNDSLLLKPRAQTMFTLAVNAVAPLKTVEEKLNYVNFYANLLKKVDSDLDLLMTTLDSLNLTNSTVVVRTADHGEMGMAHGGQRQKMFNAYEESLRVPLVFSNPLLWPEPAISDALVSHVDFVPTMASLLGAPDSLAASAGWQGVDYSGVVLGESSSAQDYVIFTYDDFQWGQTGAVTVAEPSHIVAIVNSQYKLARYYNPVADYAALPIAALDEWEFYDLIEDPLEMTNIANETYPRTPEQQQQLDAMKAQLADVEGTRLAPLMLSHPIGLTGNACRLSSTSGSTSEAAPDYSDTTTWVQGNFFGALSGAPTGNGSVTVTLGPDGVTPTSVFVYSPIGAMTASIVNPTKDMATGRWAGAAVFSSGVGVFSAVSGQVDFAFTEPPADGSADCGTVTYNVPRYCWNEDGACPGSVLLSGLIKY